MFTYTGQTLYCESVALADIAKQAGTPCYVYSDANRFLMPGAPTTPRSRICRIASAMPSRPTRRSRSWRFWQEKVSGFDIVSGGELFRVLQAGGDASKVVFSGVGKTEREVEYALGSGIHSFNCESEAELALIDSMAARLGTKAQFSLRVNPDVDAHTHPYIATGLRDHKFGIDIELAEAVYERVPPLRQPRRGRRELPYRLATARHRARYLMRPLRCSRSPNIYAIEATPSSTSISGEAWASRTRPPNAHRQLASSSALWAAASRAAASP